MDLYEQLANDYDALNPKEEVFKQRTFFHKLIKDHNVTSCLDCACGTGWHLAMLSELGLDCFGSDLSPKMLSLANDNLIETEIPLKQGDFRDLAGSWDETFDMIVCMTTSLPHMLTEKDAIAALRSMGECLNENGILVISNGVTDFLLDTRPRLLPGRLAADQAFYFFLEYFDYPSEEQVVFHILHVKKITDGFEHAYYEMPLNGMRKATLERYFATSPFRSIEYYGDYDFAPYSENESERLILVAKK